MKADVKADLAGRLAVQAVTEADFEELAALRIVAMRESLERVGRFDPQRARERLRKSFVPEHTKLLVLDGKCAGFYAFRPSEDGIHLDHLYVLPFCQSQGVGSWILRRLLAEADTQGKAVLVRALRESASNRFYLRHGFVQTHEDEWDLFYARQPASRSPKAE